MIACRARSASAAVPNNAKQVAPEPDMRARRTPGLGGKPVEQLADHRRDRARRGFEVVARGAQIGPSAPRSTPSHAANTIAVETAMPGLTSSTGTPAIARHRLEALAPAPPQRGPAEQARRNIRTQPFREREQPGIVERHAVQPCQRAQRGSGIGRPAADPRGDGKPLLERDRPRAAAKRFGEAGRRAYHEMSTSPASAAANGPRTVNDGAGAGSIRTASP